MSSAVGAGAPVTSEASECSLAHLIHSLTPEGWLGIAKFFEWPPDVFGLTSVVIERTGIHRHVVDPQSPWPPQDDWEKILRGEAKQWFEWIAQRGPMGPKLSEWMNTLDSLRGSVTAAELQHDSQPSPKAWEVCQAIFGLHALADIACGGFGLPIGAAFAPGPDGDFVSRGPGQQAQAPMDPVSLAPGEDLQERREIRLLANLLLATNGTLSRLPKQLVTVLPKMRTPQSGLTVRSLSHHLTAHQTEVSVIWRSMPWINLDEDTVNILVLPWPYEVNPGWFRVVETIDRRTPLGPDRYFTYEPDIPLPVSGVVEAVRRARKEVGRVHVIVLPELAMTLEELGRLKQALLEDTEADRPVPIIVTGVRGGGNESETEPAEHRFERNRVFMSIFFAGKWYDLNQCKHHRWKLTPGQLQQYEIAGVLSGAKNWWEDLPLDGRRLSLLAPNGWLCIAPLICEDLAQLEPCADVIRGVGPTLVLAVLLDGPQLAARWPARYASVLADDPGSSVLTVTALGMALRSKRQRAAKDPPSRVVALWKDQVTGHQELALDEGADGVVLTVAAGRHEEFTAEGRSDHIQSAVLQLLQVRQVRGQTPAMAMGSHMAEPTLKGQPTSRQGMPWDLAELTRLAFAIDAVIDSKTARWPDVLDWIDPNRSTTNGDGVWRWRPSEEIWTLINARLLDMQARRDRLLGEASGSRRPAMLPRDLQLARELVHKCLDKALASRPSAAKQSPDRVDPLAWWLSLRDVAYQLLDRVTSRQVPRPEPQFAIEDLRDAARVDVLVAQSILWAIHLRLEEQRRTGHLSQAGEIVLHEIEGRLRKAYDRDIDALAFST
jgi:hypothetical protein